jgi:hypothetical protein
MAEGRGGAFAAAAGLAIALGLGVLSKESALLTPVYTLAIEAFILHFATRPGTSNGWLKLLYLSSFVVAAALALAWLGPLLLLKGTVPGRDFSIAERLLTECRVVVQYMRWTLVPDIAQQSLYHDDIEISRGLGSPPTTLWSMVFLVAVAGLTIALRKRRPVTALGLAWFLSAHLLTATIVPLELMFEHRNYFASVGLALALVDLAMFAPRSHGARRLGGLVLACLALLYAGQTHMRAVEWNSPMRFAQSEAAKHPPSPRATYELARILVIASGYKSGSPYLEPARAALERARLADRNGILPEQAGLIVAARTGRKPPRALWASMQEKLRTKPITAQTTGALQALAQCDDAGGCGFDVQDMLDTFLAALSQGDNAEVLNIYASFALNELRDVDLALRLREETVRVRPDQAQYRINFAELLIALGRLDEARAQIAALRSIGHLGQNEAPARKLDASLAAAVARGRAR